jgi:hypothetical protein
MSTSIRTTISRLPRARLLTAVLPLALGLALLAGCKQGEGDRCEVNSDCESGLMCFMRGSAMSCQAPGSVSTRDASVDSAPAADSAPLPDAATDTRDAADLAPPPPDVGPDAATADARLDATPG